MQKRLVSKGRYVWLMTARTTLVCALVFVSLFIAFSILGLLGVILGGMSGFLDGPWIWNALFFSGCLAATCFLASRLIKKEQKIERVAPLTRRNAHLLPSEASLVRASEMPPSQQPAELLRAAQIGSETPPEQLLRATQEKVQ